MEREWDIRQRRIRSAGVGVGRWRDRVGGHRHRHCERLCHERPTPTRDDRAAVVERVVGTVDEAHVGASGCVDRRDRVRARDRAGVAGADRRPIDSRASRGVCPAELSVRGQLPTPHCCDWRRRGDPRCVHPGPFGEQGAGDGRACRSAAARRGAPAIGTTRPGLRRNRRPAPRDGCAVARRWRDSDSRGDRRWHLRSHRDVLLQPAGGLLDGSRRWPAHGFVATRRARPRSYANPECRSRHGNRGDRRADDRRCCGGCDLR